MNKGGRPKAVTSHATFGVIKPVAVEIDWRKIEDACGRKLFENPNHEHHKMDFEDNIGRYLRFKHAPSNPDFFPADVFDELRELIIKADNLIATKIPPNAQLHIQATMRGIEQARADLGDGHGKPKPRVKEKANWNRLTREIWFDFLYLGLPNDCGPKSSWKNKKKDRRFEVEVCDLSPTERAVLELYSQVGIETYKNPAQFSDHLSEAVAAGG